MLTDRPSIPAFITFTRKILLVLLLLGSGLWTKSFAQIYQPDGLRMPGDWNAWTNTTNMGGEFDLLRSSEGTNRWTTTFHYTGASGINNFKFVSTSFSDPWGNQWAGNTSLTLNTLNTFNYGTPANPDNQVTVANGKWYTVAFEDVGYTNARAIFSETSAQPVAITNVLQYPVLAAAMEPVQILPAYPQTHVPKRNFTSCIPPTTGNRR